MSACDLFPLLDAVGLAVLLLDGTGRRTTATSTVERVLGPDPERDQVLRTARALADGLRRGTAAGAIGPNPAHRDVATALATYRLTALVPRAGDARTGAAGGWSAVTIQRLPAHTTAASLRSTHGLSRREEQVARLLADGLTTAAAAAALGISPHTARHHAEHVYEKLGVRCRAALGRMLGGCATPRTPAAS